MYLWHQLPVVMRSMEETGAMTAQQRIRLYPSRSFAGMGTRSIGVNIPEDMVALMLTLDRDEPLSSI